MKGNEKNNKFGVPMLVESSVVRRVRQEGDVPPVVMGRYMKRRSIGRNEWRGRRSNNNRRVTKTKAIKKCIYLCITCMKFMNRVMNQWRPKANANNRTDERGIVERSP